MRQVQHGIHPFTVTVVSSLPASDFKRNDSGPSGQELFGSRPGSGLVSWSARLRRFKPSMSELLLGDMKSLLPAVNVSTLTDPPAIGARPFRLHNVAVKNR